MDKTSHHSALPLISIVVPVYKVESYLAQCIRSILRQTYKNFELILVDDGSPDDCGAICDDFAKRDSRIRVIHQANGGVSRARNAGLDAANGTYVAFIDADDYVTPRYLEAFSRTPHVMPDLICQGSLQLRGGKLNKKVIMKDVAGSIRKCISESNLMRQTQPWGKLFKRALITEYNIRFLEDMRWGEDCVFLLDFLLKSKNITTINSCRYIYNSDNVTSAMKTKWTANDLWMYTKEVSPRLDSLQERIGEAVHVFEASDRIDLMRSALYRQFVSRMGFSMYRDLLSSMRQAKHLREGSPLWRFVIYLLPALIQYYIMWPSYERIKR